MKSLLKEIAKRWIIGNPVKIGQKFEGQGITKDNCYLLGCCSGPERSAENLLHEMAHLSEREEEKIVERPSSGWGFSHGKYWQVAGKYGFEPQTDQQVMREARVWSYQASIMRHLGINVDIQELVSCAVYLPAFCLFNFKSVPNWKDMSCSESEEKSVDILAKLVQDQTATYTFEKWEEAWFKRMDLLKKN